MKVTKQSKVIEVTLHLSLDEARALSFALQNVRSRFSIIDMVIENLRDTVA